MGFIGNLFRTPSSFEGDPKGYGRNQGAHMVIVGGGMGLLGLLWAAATGLAGWPVVAAGLTLYALWEAFQYVIHAAEAWDCVEDFVFVLCGALAVMVHPIIAVIGALFLLSGVLRRHS